MSPPAIHTLSLHDALPILLLDPGQVEDLVMRELGDTALFGARFRENAGRALLIPRRRPGERTPRSEERRVGKEGRGRCARGQGQQRKKAREQATMPKDRGT